MWGGCVHPAVPPGTNTKMQCWQQQDFFELEFIQDHFYRSHMEQHAFFFNSF